MSTTTAHRHVHVPTAWVIVAAVIVAAVIIAIAVAQQSPTTTIPEVTATDIVALPGAASVPKPESLGLREAIKDGVYPVVATVPTVDYTHRQIQGATLDQIVPGTMPIRPYRYRMNQFESEP